VTHHIKASTPEEARDEIVKWLKTMASYRRIDAAKARRVSMNTQLMAVAGAYEAAATYINDMIIQTRD